MSPKSTYSFLVYVALACYLHYLLSRVRATRWSSFFLVHCVLYLHFVVFLSAWKVSVQNQGWLELLSCVCSHKTSVQAIFCHLPTQLSPSPALLWKLALASPLWKCCQSAEWEFFSGELEPVSEQQHGSSCSLGADFAIIGNYEGFVIVLQLHCLLHLFRWLLYGAVFQLGCPPFICQASKTT